MIGLVLLLITSLFTATIIKREIEEVIPPVVLSLLLACYALAILKHAHYAYRLFLCAFALVTVVFVVTMFLRVKKSRAEFARTESATTAAGQSPSPTGRRILQICLAWIGKHAGLLVFLAVCVVMLWCYHNHFVMVWDDFHYNATFPKNCYAFGTMPTGYQLATPYKSYLPLMQLFFYWGFQGSGFSEPLMFQYKMVLIYVLILPLFARIRDVKGWAKVAVGVSAAILPFLFLYEVQESLSMDTVMGLLFAYAVLMILYEEKHDWFRLIRILLALMCLTLIKSIALIFTAIALATWFLVLIVEWKRRKRGIQSGVTANADKPRRLRMEVIGLLGSGICCALAYISWKVFCERNDNTNYLSTNLASNLKDGIRMPAYGAETIQNMLKSLFTLPTNLGRWGFSIAGVIAVAVITIAILKMIRQLTHTDITAAIVLFLGLIGYLSVLGYTYLFVFEQWEAESLSSFDRYLGTYSIMLCYTVLYRLTLVYEPVDTEVDTDETSAEKKHDLYAKNGYPTEESRSIRISTMVLPVLAIVLFCSLPFADLVDSVIPARYLVKREKMYADRQEVREEMADFTDGDYPMGTMLAVNCEGNTIYDRGLDYEVLPHISKPINVADFAANERPGALQQMIQEMDPDYVYFTAHERAYEDISTYELPAEYEALDGVDGMFRKTR